MMSLKQNLLGIVAFAVAGPALAVPVTVDFQPGTLFNTTALSAFTTGAGDMDGLEISASFSDGTTDTAILNGTTAAGSGWSVSFAGSTTFSSPWEVTAANTSGLLISSLTFSGAPGSTVFDVGTANSPTSSPGSAQGKTIDSSNNTYIGSTVSSVEATYVNEVAVGGTVFGDLFETLILDFNQGLASNDIFSFVTDTDNSAIKGDVVVVDAPEPGTLALLGLGLLGLSVSRKRSS